MAEHEPCPGCSLLLPPHDGPTHPYIGASAACWALFGAVLARQYGGFADLGAAHRLTVDAYAVQHPGEPERRSMRSVCLHLVALQLALERELPLAQVTQLLARGGERLTGLRWLVPPDGRGDTTIADVSAASSPGEHVDRVWAWARDVWQAWHPHHATVRAWADAVLEGVGWGQARGV